MHRTQVLLTKEQVQKLRAEAAQRQVSMAQLIREAVDAYLSRRERREARCRAVAVVGRFASGRRDIAKEHDRELEQIYAEVDANSEC
jgi:Arc/MetJ-type ribon-helix-helix transcriptional regulator